MNETQLTQLAVDVLAITARERPPLLGLSNSDIDSKIRNWTSTTVELIAEEIRATVSRTGRPAR